MPAAGDALLARLPERLEGVARDVLGLDARIDVVALDRRGQVVLVLAAVEGEDRARFTDALAQRAWVAARLPDWAQLAPERRIAPELGVRVLLVGGPFDPRTRAAAASLGPDGGVQLVEETAAAAAPVPPSAPEPAPTPLRSVFRTGLQPGDLAG
jgi:hypothetical protein